MLMEQSEVPNKDELEEKHSAWMETAKKYIVSTGYTLAIGSMSYAILKTIHPNLPPEAFVVTTGIIGTFSNGLRLWFNSRK